LSDFEEIITIIQFREWGESPLYVLLNKLSVLTHQKLFKYVHANMLTLKLEKIIGWTFLISKVGITTLVNVSCNLVSCNSSRVLSCKNLPSNLGRGEL